MWREPLQDAVVLRRGITARQWTEETRNIKCGKNGKKAELYCEISSKGGGWTAVSIQIGSQDFSALIQSMCEADRHSAMMTLVTELTREITKQPERDAVLVQETQESITELARCKYMEAPHENDHVEHLVYKGVEKLVEELSPRKKRKAKTAFKLNLAGSTVGAS
jgi:hypothetical protein